MASGLWVWGFKFKLLVFKKSSLRFGDSGWGFRRGSALGLASVMVVSLSALACSISCSPGSLLHSSSPIIYVYIYICI